MLSHKRHFMKFIIICEYFIQYAQSRPPTHLVERLDFGVHNEREFAEFT